MTSPERVPVTAALARFIVAHNYDRMPDNVRMEAKRGIADCLGCIIVGADTAVGRNIQAYVRDETGPSRVWGTSIHTSPQNAALANGTLAHAHDLDDANENMRGHASAPVVPAILAVADQIPATEGRDLLAAYAVGVELEGKVGISVMKTHPERGWHATATLGTLGATAAVANLLKLDEIQTRNALGIAASLASGLRVNFGTMTKPLHAGIAAQNGVLAARLASAGIDSSPVALEGWQGFYDLFAGFEESRLEAAIARLGAPFELIDGGIDYKLYPSCSLSHPPIDIVLDGLSSGEIDVADIERVRCGVDYRLLTNMMYGQPETPLEGKFSMPFCLAAALLYGRVGFEQFQPEVVNSEAVRALIAKTEVYVHPELQTPDTLPREFADVEVIHRSGKVFHKRTSKSRGHPTKPLTIEQHREKFLMCTEPSMGHGAAGTLWERVMELDQRTVAELA